MLFNELPPIMESEHIVAFKDCDPLGHLNNIRYLDMFLAAREEQFVGQYGIDFLMEARLRGNSWVVSNHRISYLSQVNSSDRILIQTRAVRWGETDLTVEYLMRDAETWAPRAVMWTYLVYISLKNGKRTAHEPDILQWFQDTDATLERHTSFEEREAKLKVELKQEAVTLSSWSPRWNQRFAMEKQRLQKLFHEKGLPEPEIAHVGGTSVPGHKSQPIVDVMVGLQNPKDMALAAELLKSSGYIPHGDWSAENPSSSWPLFRVISPARRQTHAVHLVPKDSSTYREGLGVRDLLRKNPEQAQAYAVQKERWAQMHRNSPEQYALEKQAAWEELLRLLQGN